MSRRSLPSSSNCYLIAAPHSHCNRIMETYREQEEREQAARRTIIEEKAAAIQTRKLCKSCRKCNARFLSNNIKYNEEIQRWEHRDCEFVAITNPITVARLRENAHQLIPRNTTRMMAPSSGRKPGFYLIRVERQSDVDCILYSLADLDDDFVVTESRLLYNGDEDIVK